MGSGEASLPLQLHLRVSLLDFYNIDYSLIQKRNCLPYKYKFCTFFSETKITCVKFSTIYPGLKDGFRMMITWGKLSVESPYMN